jgi:antitoxin ParD1/3/4
MHVSLTDQLEKMVKAKVASGMYNNASEVIRESLRFMETHEAWIYQIKLDKLRSEVNKGLNLCLFLLMIVLAVYITKRK